MKLRKVFITVTVISIVLLGCTKKEATYEVSEVNGIRITQNTGVPADSTFRIELKEVGFIDMENESDSLKLITIPISYDFDKEGNLYILDFKKCMIHKYNHDFEQISVFGGKGQGPGEFVQARKFLIVGDTMLVADTRQWKINKLDLEGKFIVDKKYSDGQKALVDFDEFGSGFINKFYGSSRDESEQTFSIETISFFDSQLNFVKFIYEYKELFDWDKVQDPSLSGSVHTVYKNDLYISVNSKTDYKIDVYDVNGIKKRIINKNYARVKNSEENIKKQEENSKKYGLKYRTEFLNSIYQMNTDKYGRLWVISTVKEKEEGWYYDIFQDDIFLKRIKLNLEKGYSVSYIGEKILAVNWDNNNIKIYEY